ncbi:sodium:proton antiporter [Thermococci archaeon]|nr:MAG: sodium:proton antiporter [Thermococci archaeon]RLF93326.1 MAG: sodium:proton antiporter [Thermococci archaeon]
MLEIIHEILLMVIVVLAIIIIESKNFISAIILYGVLSAIFAVVLFQLQAPDVALSSIVAGIALFGVFIFVIHKTEECE